MKSIALTGTIGSGKTLICSVFEHLGVPVFIADREAIKLYNNSVFLQEIALEFGKEVLKDGRIDKKALAKIVFKDKTKLEKLNSIIHPKVWDSFLSWRDNQNAPYVIMETAIVFEIGWDKRFDKIISIDSPKEISIQRAMLRDNTSLEEVELRMKNQFTNEEKVSRADYKIFHDNNTMLLPQILDIHKRIIN